MQWTGGAGAGFTTGRPWLPIPADAATRNVEAEKAAAGYGGTSAVSRATGVAHSTVIRGAKLVVTSRPEPQVVYF